MESAGKIERHAVPQHRLRERQDDATRKADASSPINATAIAVSAKVLVARPPPGRPRADRRLCGCREPLPQRVVAESSTDRQH